MQKVPTLPETETCSLLLFYHYIDVPLTEKGRDSLKAFLESMSASAGVGGRLRVAQEGLNCTVSGSRDGVRDFSRRLSSWRCDDYDGNNGDCPFGSGVDFKYVDDLPPDRAFKDLKVLPVKELVFYGVGEKEAPLANGGVHLDPVNYNAKLKEPNTVVIDVRNSYEAEIGKFIGQEKHGGAEYIDPKMRKVGVVLLCFDYYFLFLLFLLLLLLLFLLLLLLPRAFRLTEPWRPPVAFLSPSLLVNRFCIVAEERHDQGQAEGQAGANVLQKGTLLAFASIPSGDLKASNSKWMEMMWTRPCFSVYFCFVRCNE